MRHSIYRNVVIACSVIFTFGCNHPSPVLEDEVSSAPADVPKRYQFIYSPGLSEDEYVAAQAGVPYGEIHFQRTGCFGECPAYTVTLRSDGTAQFVGESFVSNIGDYDGEVDIRRFGRLCWAIDRFKLDEFSSDFSGDWTDDATAKLTVKDRDNETVLQISDYGAHGPIELWAVHQIVDALASKIEWKRSK